MELWALAVDDWEQGKIDKKLYRYLGSVFHPDFRNIWDYVPSDRRDYLQQLEMLDSEFWNYYP